ncbi:MAG: DUF1059 domain-containing protein [Candidatus Aenigmatarchaeota archaeon]
MKTLACADLGVDKECDFKASGEDDGEVIDAMFEHAEKVHKDKVKKMSEEDKEEMEEKMYDLLDTQK